jgi:cytochrome c biogenesis protein CcmG/thiol:disulfide interchange protein DsbE
MNARTMAVPEERSPARTPNRLVNLAVVAVTAVVIAAVAFIANQPASTSGVTPVDLPGTATGPAPIVGKTAPDLTAIAVDGSQVKLSDLAGKPVWLTFGASWCQPCRAENPDIEAAYERFKDRGVVVMQVYMSEDQAAVEDYTTRVGLTYLRVPDPAYALADQYRVLGIPSHFFIDRSGVLHALKVGTLDPASMDAALTEIAG